MDYAGGNADTAMQMVGAGGDPNDEFDRPKVHYVCGGKLNLNAPLAVLTLACLSRVRLWQGQHFG